MKKSDFQLWQWFIAVSSPSALLLTLGFLWYTWKHLPLAEIVAVADRLHVLSYSFVALAAAVFIPIVHIGNLRFLHSEAINPLEPATNPQVIVFSRILQNTLEQAFIFGLLVLAIVALPGNEVRLIPAALGTFLLGRILFAIGYSIHWKYRAPGMAMTYGSSIGLFVLAIHAFLQ